MAKEKTNLDTLAPNQSSAASAVLNGISNGLMISAVPIACISLLSKQPEAGKGRWSALFEGSSLASVGIGAAGILGGAIYGVHEARQLKQYRSALVDEVEKLQDELHGLKTKLEERPPHSWAEKADAANSTHSAPSL